MNKNLLLALIIGGCEILYGCKKAEKEESTPPTELGQLTTLKQQYAPYEIVQIRANGIVFGVDSFPAIINNINLMVYSKDTVASFLLPDLSNGKYEMKFSLNNKNYNIPVTVVGLSDIISPDQYFNDIKSGISQNIDKLNSQIVQLEQNSTTPNEYENIKNDVVQYTNLLTDYTNSYNKLSDTEKQDFVKTLAANKAYMDEYNAMTSDFNQSTSTLRTAQSIQNYEAQARKSKLIFVGSVIYTVGHIPFILAGGKVAAASAGNPFVIVSLGVVVTSFMVNVMSTATMGKTLVEKALKPYDFITQTPMSTSQIVYEKGVEADLNTQAEYRSLINSDNNDGSNGSTISTIVEKYNYFRDKYNGFINLLPSILKPSYVVSSMKNSYKIVTRSVYNQYISISNVSNSKVALQQLNQPDGSIKIKATTTENTDQEFSYDVNYTGSDFTIGLKKTVTATLKTDPACNLSTFTDSRDGEVYKIVQIGTQTWLAENLRYSGDIPNITDYNQWTNNTTGAWCYYLNDPSYNVIYGKLYNWHALNNFNICPSGWHVPSDAEWSILSDFLGGEAIAGSKMKTTGTQYWDSPNTDATNSSCFSGLPAGHRNNAGIFNNRGVTGSWWSTTANNVGGAWYRGVGWNSGKLDRADWTKLAGQSVRCIKD